MSKYRKLLSINTDTKTVKGNKAGYLTGILYLAPSNTVKNCNTCPYASKGCKQACLYTAGRGKFSNVKAARINKTELFRDQLDYFMQSLIVDIKVLIRKAKRENLIPVVRLNGTSDIDWENIKCKGRSIFEIFPSIQFYDYTKNYNRFETRLPPNYHLTYSLSETKLSSNKAQRLINHGHNVAIVFKSVPQKYYQTKVIDGDKTDLRFLDISTQRGFVIGLTAKGDARKDYSGFVK